MRIWTQPLIFKGPNLLLVSGRMHVESVKSSFYVVESSDFVLRSRVIRWSIGSKHIVPMERRAWDSPAAPTTAGWSLFQRPPLKNVKMDGFIVSGPENHFKKSLKLYETITYVSLKPIAHT